MIGIMLDWFLETGVYVLGIILTPAVGLALLCWGLWGDRSKGRSRCPKCWYDMRGTLPRLECPECGHHAKQNRRLYKDRQGWRRISLGVVLLLLATVPLTIIGDWYLEQAVIRKLTERTNDPSNPMRVRPTWLVPRLPERFARFFDRAASVSLGSQATDVDLAECGKLPNLRHLSLNGAQATDAGIARLRGLSRLQILRMSDTQVTDAGLAHVGRLSQLHELSVCGTQMTDAGLEHLKRLPHVQVLGLGRTRVTDTGLVHLNGMSQLRELNLSDTQVTDAGLVRLKRLSQLQRLWLRDTQVTDAGLVHLMGLSGLELLSLDNTQVTDAGVARLKQALPNVTVKR